MIPFAYQLADRTARGATGSPNYSWQRLAAEHDWALVGKRTLVPDTGLGRVYTIPYSLKRSAGVR